MKKEKFRWNNKLQFRWKDKQLQEKQSKVRGRNLTSEIISWKFLYKMLKFLILYHLFESSSNKNEFLLGTSRNRPLVFWPNIVWYLPVTLNYFASWYKDDDGTTVHEKKRWNFGSQNRIEKEREKKRRNAKYITDKKYRRFLLSECLFWNIQYRYTICCT